MQREWYYRSSPGIGPRPTPQHLSDFCPGVWGCRQGESNSEYNGSSGSLYFGALFPNYTILNGFGSITSIEVHYLQHFISLQFRKWELQKLRNAWLYWTVQRRPILWPQMRNHQNHRLVFDWVDLKVFPVLCTLLCPLSWNYVHILEIVIENIS